MTIVFFSILPYRFVQLIARFFAVLLRTPFAYRHAVIAKNLQQSFLEKEANFYKQTAKAYYNHLSDLIFETLKGFSFTQAKLHQHVHYKNPEIFTPYLEKGQSCILVGSHCNNWELACLSFPLWTPYPVFTAYKPLSNTYLNKYLSQLRSKWGMQMVPMRQLGRTLIVQKNKPSLFIFLADQSPASTDHAIWVDFLNRETPFIHGVEKIARKTKYPVFYFSIAKKKRGYYEVTIQELSLPASQANTSLTKLYAAELEKEILEAPSHWLWSHRRWKRGRS